MIGTIKRGFALAVKVFLQVCYSPIRLLPARKQITFISRQQDTPSLDFELFAQEFTRRHPDWTVEFLCYEFHSSLAKKLGYFGHVFTQMRHISRSRLVVLDTYCIPVSVLRHKDSLRVIQMWHALGSLKKFGYSILDVGEGSSSDIARIMHMHANYDAVVASSRASTPAFAEAFNVPEAVVHPIPLPRVDALRDTERRDHTRTMLLEQYPELAGKKNVLFAPTFKKGQVFAADALHAYFARHGYNLIAKPHPVALSDTDVIARRYADHSSFDFLSVADYLVTDYSSIMFEAGIADIPVLIFAPDLGEYLEERDFYIDFAAEVPFPIATGFEGLVDNLKQLDREPAEFQDFIGRYVELPQDRRCTEAIADLADSLLDQPVVD
ncbi:CDP-glycerol glycerophosphotransferase family protein [Populibacterium corticicola]|uniref:CDP-glycerol glycerophosphotransferase family protein n=1 Tax=Populibacterium corticicola TaxID=1812826 RepID=A0ABW5XD71_9MICO